MHFVQPGQNWANGRIHSQTEPLSYKANINCTLWRRHIDPIVGTSKDQPSAPTLTSTEVMFVPSVGNSGTTEIPEDRVTNPMTNGNTCEPRPCEPHRNLPRNRKKPDRLNLLNLCIWFTICANLMCYESAFLNNVVFC
jgi:hypothetical protein